MTTRNDVAKKAGVAPATVSRVLNNYKHVKPDVRERVLAAANELNYHPHLAARSLKTNKSYTIAFIVPNISNPYFTEIYTGINKFSAERGYVTLIYEGNPDVDYINLLVQRQIDGFIIAIEAPRECFKILETQGIPFVYLALSREYHETCSIISNIHTAAAQLINYLVEMGHTKVGFITKAGSLETARIKAYSSCIEKSGLEFSTDHISFFEENAYNYSQGYESMMNLLGNGNDLTVIVIDNDLLAIGAMAAITAMGLKVPDDISVACFNDSVAAAYCNPPLTTVKFLKHKQGILAARMLLDLIDGKEVQSVELDTELIIRSSVRRIL